MRDENFSILLCRLIETGEKDRLKELLRQKLIDSGWRDDLKEYCKEVIRNKGLEKITVDELVAEITPRGRATVPDDVKTELLQNIRKFLQVRSVSLFLPRKKNTGDLNNQSKRLATIQEGDFYRGASHRRSIIAADPFLSCHMSCHVMSVGGF